MEQETKDYIKIADNLKVATPTLLQEATKVQHILKNTSGNIQTSSGATEHL
jgi:hypothetical protein